MTVIELTPDAIAVKLQTEKRWADSTIGRTERLTPWTLARAEDGSLFLSAQICGPDPAHVLDRFIVLQCSYMDTQTVLCGDQMPVLDMSVPGRTTCAWRSNGVWVELWHLDSGGASLSPVVPRPASVRQVPLARASGRLPFTRHPARNETSA